MGKGLDSGDVVVRARRLLGRVLHGHGVSARITEVEAYGGTTDPASHAYTRTPRSDIMYGESGRLYVYRSYGVHWCANIVTGPTEQAAAVLLRAGVVVDGIDVARQRRGAVADVALARGPGNFAAALGITGDDLGTDVFDPAGVHLSDEYPARADISAGPRVGVSQAADVPWRFWLTDDLSVSTYRRAKPRRAG